MPVNPVLRWMANNVSLETDAADNWKPSKKRSRERIDGIVALIMAVGMCANARPNSSRSIRRPVSWPCEQPAMPNKSGSAAVDGRQRVARNGRRGQLEAL